MQNTSWTIQNGRVCYMELFVKFPYLLILYVLWQGVDFICMYNVETYLIWTSWGRSWCGWGEEWSVGNWNLQYGLCICRHNCTWQVWLLMLSSDMCATGSMLGRSLENVVQIKVCQHFIPILFNCHPSATLVGMATIWLAFGIDQSWNFSEQTTGAFEMLQYTRSKIWSLATSPWGEVSQITQVLNVGLTLFLQSGAASHQSVAYSCCIAFFSRYWLCTFKGLWKAWALYISQTLVLYT